MICPHLTGHHVQTPSNAISRQSQISMPKIFMLVKCKFSEKLFSERVKELFVCLHFKMLSQIWLNRIKVLVLFLWGSWTIEKQVFMYIQIRRKIYKFISKCWKQFCCFRELHRKFRVVFNFSFPLFFNR